MKISAYLVEYSDDKIEWRASSIHLHLINAVEAADKISYPFRICQASLDVGEAFSKEQISEARNLNNKLTKTLTELFQ